jgi:TonB family protein
VTPIQLPKDPNELMTLAAKTNGLAGLNDRPWHVKLMYQTYDEDGKPGHMGILEEWWESAKKYKYIYTFPGFQQTTYRDGKHEVVTGDAGWPPIKRMADRVEDFLWTPLPPASVAANPLYYVKYRKFGQAELTCVQPGAVSPLLSDDAVTLMAKEAYRVPTTCFDEDSAAARVEVTYYGLVAVMNNIVEFDGHYIAKQITLEDGGLPVVTLNVMQLDFPDSIPDAKLVGSDAAPAIPGEFRDVPAGVMVDRRLGGDNFDYPKAAKEKNLSGYVQVEVDLDEKGHIVGQQAVMGPRILLDPVENWVKTWTYRPYRVKGTPVKVRTVIAVIFRASDFPPKTAPAASAPMFAKAALDRAVSKLDAGPPPAPGAAELAPAPTNARDLMVLAAKTNGLAGLEDRPWHLKANYQIFDADGNQEQSGVLEEWSAGPKKSRTSYAGAGFNQTVYVGATGRAVTGDVGEPPMQLQMAKDYLMRPLPSDNFVAKLSYDARNQKLGSVEMRCVEPKPTSDEFAREAMKDEVPGGAGMMVPTTCFNKGLAAVRMERAQSPLVALFNHVEDAGGQYVAKSIEIGDGGVPLVNLSVTALDFPKSIPEAELASPAGAVTDSPQAVGAGVMAGYRIGGEAVRYPMAAKEQRLQGLVILAAKIDKSGKIADLKLIAGPKVLRDAAVQAVKTWKYKPYLLNGQAVAVSTQINVIFTLGG